MKKVAFKIATRRRPETRTGYQIAPADPSGPWYVWRPTEKHQWSLTHGPSGFCCANADTIPQLIRRVENFTPSQRSQIDCAPGLSAEAAQ